MDKSSFLALSPHGFHRIAYVAWGNRKAARTVICLHGLTRNGRDFDVLANALADEFRVICPDMPGRGKSEPLSDPTDYQYPVYLQICAVLLAHLGCESVDWIGTSMGGLIGMMLAAQPNSPIRHLVLNDVGALIPGAALERIANYVGNTGPFPTLEAVEQRLRSVHSAFGNLTDEQWQHLAMHGHWQDPDGQFRLAYDPAIADSIRTDVYPDIDLGAVWASVQCPTLIIRGEDSDILPASVAESMVATHPLSSTISFTGVGHAPALMAGDQIRAIRSWLNDS